MPDRIPLRQRVLNASAWSLGGYGISQAIRFGSNLVMTRLLVPKMFGVMAIATVVMIGLAMFSDLGLRQNIVQSRRGGDPAFLNTAWAVQILRGLLLWVFALGISLVILLADRTGVVPKDSVYADPSLPYVIAVLSFSTVIFGFGSTKSSEASRNLALGRVTQIEIAAQICGVLCMLGWALIERSIWALVAGGICSALVSVVLSHAWLPGTANRWHWDSGAFAEIFHFGKWIFASSILGFLASSGDRLLLGGMVDAATLGVYVIAFLIFSAVEQLMTRIIGGVALPALSEIARNRGELKAGYYRLHAVIAAITYFCAGALMQSGQALIGMLYDQRYTQAGWMLEILAVGLMTTPFQIAVQCYLALGMPHLHSKILVVRLIGLLATMPIGFYFLGVPGALWGVVASQFLCLPIFIINNVRNRVFDLRSELLLFPIVLVGMGAGKLFTLAVGH